MEKILLTLVASVIAFAAVSGTTPGSDKIKGSTYVLVHGAWQAPYVWDVVKNDLQKKGHTVIVVELPGHGKDQTKTHTLSLDAYRDAVINALSKVTDKVILVGHSMGGMVITNVAEKIPTKISKLVYIGAFLPTSGQALSDLAYSDPDSKLGTALVPSADQLTLDVKNESLVDLFISDGSAEAKKSVTSNYRAEPAIPFTNKVTLSAENFGTVEKVYIKTLKDIVISPGLQDRMIAAAGIKTVYTVNTSHSPFLSQPHEVSELLLTVGK